PGLHLPLAGARHGMADAPARRPAARPYRAAPQRAGGRAAAADAAHGSRHLVAGQGALAGRPAAAANLPPRAAVATACAAGLLVRAAAPDLERVGHLFRLPAAL